MPKDGAGKRLPAKIECEYAYPGSAATTLRAGPDRFLHVAALRHIEPTPPFPRFRAMFLPNIFPRLGAMLIDGRTALLKINRSKS
jgi:hypothetical protein